MRNLYTQFTSGRFTEAVAGSGLSYIDLFRKPGTFHVKYFPLVYYNRLYQGNWTATDYTAASGSYIEYADNTTYGGTKRDSGTPLRFHFIQGTDPVRIKTSNDYLDMT